MLNCKAFLFCLASVVISFTCLVSDCLPGSSGPGFQPMLVWGEKDKQGKYAIHFSRFSGEQWSKAETLSTAGRQNILPAVSSGDQANILVAWTELEGIQGKILFCFYANEKWSAPERVETSTVSDMAPSLAISGNGVQWMVFSGSDGIQDDIYSVHWTGEKWSEPLKVNIDDDWPDILPEITVASDGQPVVSWQGYNGKEYVTYSSHWNGVSWSMEEEGPAQEMVSRKKRSGSSADGRRDTLLQNLPEFLTDTSQAVFHHYRDGKAETIKLKKQR